MSIYRFEEWKEKIRDRDEVRNYKHLDSKINIKNDDHLNLVEETINSLKNHQFLPFIKKVDRHSRYRRKKCDCNNLKQGTSCSKKCSSQKEKKIKPRPLMYASHLDSYIYSYYNFILGDFYERKLDDEAINSGITAYRKIPTEKNPEKNKCNIHFAKEAFDEVSRQKECIVITSDITGFFDNLDHRKLKESIIQIVPEDELGPRLYKLFKSLTNYKYIDYYHSLKLKKVKKILRKRRSVSNIFWVLKDYIKTNKSDKGIPQGSPISGLLSNIYMLDFDRSFFEKMPNIFYRRYSDDIFIVCQEGDKEEVLKFLFENIIKSRLTIQNEKTNISYFKNGQFVKVEDGSGAEKGRKYVDYLGFEFDGRKVQMRKGSLGKLRDKQERKVKKQIRNMSYKFNPKSKFTKKRRSNYLRKAQEEFNDPELNKQIRSLSKRRNKTRDRRRV